MHKPRPELLRIDKTGCKVAAHIIAEAEPELVLEVIARPETDGRVRKYLEARLASFQAERSP